MERHTGMKSNSINAEHGNMMMKSNNWISKVFLMLMISILSVSVALASPLTKPKADGLIGEQANGYIGLVKQSAPADIKSLVRDVNAKRKAGYQKIAAKQGTSLSDVEKVGGNTAIEKTLRGNYIRSANGSWRKK
jgi:uncharacterized protein YdbL (DUF1318 family)